MTMTSSRGFGVLAVATILGLVGACQADTAQLLSTADTLAYEGQDVAAEHRLRQLVAQRCRPGKDTALATEQQCRQAYLSLARLNTTRLRNYPQALADWSALWRSGDTDPLAVTAMRHSADLLRHHLDRPERALAVLKEAIKSLGGHADGAVVRAELMSTYVELGNYDSAAEQARDIIERWPLSASAMVARQTLGQTAYLAGDWHQALAAYEALIGAHPGPEVTAMALVGTGDCLQEQGEAARALDAYYAALKDHPNPEMVQTKVARVRARLYHLAPKDRILNASRPSRHVAAWQPRPTPADLGFDRVPPRHVVELAPTRP